MDLVELSLFLSNYPVEKSLSMARSLLSTVPQRDTFRHWSTQSLETAERDDAFEIYTKSSVEFLAALKELPSSRPIPYKQSRPPASR